MFSRTFSDNDNPYGFNMKYYGFNIHPDRLIEHFRHYGNTLPKDVNLITMDEFFKTQEGEQSGTSMILYPNNKPATIFYFDPKEDITTFELAKCLSFSNHSSFVRLDEGFFSDEPFMRHFKQIQ